MPRARRTVRKPTRWTDAEWRRVEDAAPVAGVPALRFVREAALEKADALRGAAPPPAPSRRRRAGDELVHQLARVLNNLRQLQRVAEDDWDDDNARLAAEVIRTAEAATAAAPEGAREAAALLAAIGPMGSALNDLAHAANTAEHLPPDAADVLVSVFATLTKFLR